MEDGTLTITDPKVETTGMPQGSFLKRQKVAKEDGSYLGPDDFHIGAEVTICGHTFHICGWFFEENGVAIEEEPWTDGIFCYFHPQFRIPMLCVALCFLMNIHIDAWQTNCPRPEIEVEFQMHNLQRPLRTGSDVTNDVCRSRGHDIRPCYHSVCQLN